MDFSKREPRVFGTHTPYVLLLLALLELTRKTPAFMLDADTVRAAWGKAVERVDSVQNEVLLFACLLLPMLLAPTA